QHGFRRALGTQRPETTQRNLFGQLDGSANPELGSDHFSEVVWIDDGPFAGGTSMVLRRIRMDLDGWDEVDRVARDNSTGTRQDTGGPLSGGGEFDEPDFAATSEHGFPIIPEFAHVRRARGVDEGEHQEIFRRPYNYDVPPPAVSEAVSEAGQIFVSFQADLLRQFLPIQQRLSDLDLLNPWTTPIGSAGCVSPPGCAEGESAGPRGQGWGPRDRSPGSRRQGGRAAVRRGDGPHRRVGPRPCRRSGLPRPGPGVGLTHHQGGTGGPLQEDTATRCRTAGVSQQARTPSSPPLATDGPITRCTRAMHILARTSRSRSWPMMRRPTLSTRRRTR